MKSYYRCNFFNNKFVAKEQFDILQHEISLKDTLKDGKHSFEKKQIKYECKWNQHEQWDSNKPCILIPIRDNRYLLEITIKNLLDNKINDQANIIIIDDRSSEDIKSISVKNMSYLRIDNTKGFNFSMLMNIAAGVCNSLDIKEIVLWNSDLWAVDKNSFSNLLKRHRENNSLISGSKLLYPPKEMSLNGEEDSENIKSFAKSMLNGKWRSTIQFGGDAWIQTPGSPISLSPIHYKRFSDPKNPLVNCDRGVCFVTGALQVWDLQYYINIGGLNPSLSRNFQDVDICLRSVELNNIPIYFGKELYFYHDESAVLNNIKNEKKNNKQMHSDHVLFGKIWNNKINGIVF
tara:strand:+ start:203 stop:1243 length:1041 start_codon:yes stop_codon:yes gene_type:complete